MDGIQGDPGSQKQRGSYLGFGRPRQVWRAAYPMLLFVALNFAVGILFGILYYAVGFDVSGHVMEIQLILEVVGFAVFLPLWLRTRRRYTRYSGGRVNWPTALLVVGLALGTWSIASILAGLLAPLFPSYREIEAQLSSGRFVTQLLAVGILGPLAEEFCFRGVTLSRMENLRPWLAVLVTSLLFGVCHLNPVQGIYGALTGAVLGFLCVRFLTIWYAVIAHMTINLLSVLLIHLPGGDGSQRAAEGILLLLGIALFFVCGALLLRRGHPPTPPPPGAPPAAPPEFLVRDDP